MEKWKICCIPIVITIVMARWFLSRKWRKDTLVTERGHLTNQELRRSLNLIIIEITLGMIYVNATTGVIFTGFTRLLGANELIYGVMMAMPVIGGIMQLFASYIIENTGKRKEILIICGIIQRTLWILVALVPFLITGDQKMGRILAVTVIITISSTASSFVQLAYFSWVGDLVPAAIKGRFFSKRTAVSTASGIAAGLLASMYIDRFNDIKAFSIVFIFGSIMGIASILCYMRVWHPPIKIAPKRIPLRQLIAIPFRDKNYTRFICFAVFWNFGIGFCDPYYNIYMLERLDMTYMNISLTNQVISSIMVILFVRRWGRVSDSHGARPVIALCGSVVAVIPLLWLSVTPANFYMIFFINAISGLFASGFNFNVTNMSVWLASEKNRSIYIAVYILFVSVVGTAASYICGGAFLHALNPMLERWQLRFLWGIPMSGYHLLFMSACLIRLCALTFFIKKVGDDGSKSVKSVLALIARRITRRPAE